MRIERERGSVLQGTCSRRRRVLRAGHWRAWMFEKQRAFLDRQCTPTTFRASALESESAARLLRLRPIASVDVLHVCESNGSILFTSVVEVEGALCQEDKPTIEILGDG